MYRCPKRSSMYQTVAYSTVSEVGGWVFSDLFPFYSQPFPWTCAVGCCQRNNLAGWCYTVKKVSSFPVPSRDAINQTLSPWPGNIKLFPFPCQGEFGYGDSPLETGKSLTLQCIRRMPCTPKKCCVGRRFESQLRRKAK
jgi:hypothetical protein